MGATAAATPASSGNIYRTTDASGFEPAPSAVDVATALTAGPGLSVDDILVQTPAAVAAGQYVQFFDHPGGGGAPAANAICLIGWLLEASKLYDWNPPNGWEFVNGLWIVVSSTPAIYTPIAGGGLISLTVRRKVSG